MKKFAEMRQVAMATAATRYSRKELACLNLLKGAHQETIVRLLRDSAVRVLGKGEMLLRAGDSCEALYLVLSGRLRMQDPSSTVPDTLVNAGDSIGELFLLQEAVLAWTISALEPTRLLTIDKTTAWALIGASHEIARNWLALLAERSRVGGTIGGSEELKTSYKRHATLDENTGLHNRHWLESMLPRQIARSAMSNAPLGLLLMEIDQFAEYRAHFGHVAGDHASYAAAQTLANNVRPTDLVTCYGAGLFAVVLPESDIAGVCLVAERVRYAVSEAVVVMSDESILPSLTVSVGAAQFRPPMDAVAFMAAAEAALQTARSTGGNRVGMQLSEK